jgi:hypothetical protein
MVMVFGEILLSARGNDDSPPVGGASPGYLAMPGRRHLHPGTSGGAWSGCRVQPGRAEDERP